MMRAISVQPESADAVDSVVLSFDDRHRRRMVMTGENGTAFLLDLADATALADGNGLVLEDGRVVAVRAAAEPLLEITCRDQAHLVRVAWHLGNRHLPTQLLDDRLRIRTDHVIADMARGLGADVTEISAPFQPEGGAYGHGRVHSHEHGHGHNDGHHHGHTHD
ncbi:MAG: urease accessory protein UreE [Pseudomonadota bacterium]